MAAPAMVVRVAANIDELRKNLTDGRQQIELTTGNIRQFAKTASGEAAPAMRLLGEATERADPPGKQIAQTYRQFDGVLQSVGINIGPQVKGIEDIASAAGKSAKQIGALGTAGLVLGAGVAGWGIGRMIAEFTGADKAVEGFATRLFGLKSASAEAAGAVQATINRAIAMGAQESIRYKDAIEFIIQAQKRGADESINWRDRLADAHKELRGLSDATIQEIAIAKDAGATTEQLTNKFHLSATALKLLAERQKDAAEATKDHAREAAALDKAYDKLMSEVKNANQLALMEADAAKLAQVAQDRRQKTALALRDAMFESARASNEHVKVDQALSAEQAQIDAENQALMASYRGAAAAADEGGKVTKAAADGSARAFAGVAAQVTFTGDAIKEWINLMRYSASVNSILSENSLFTTTSQRQRIAGLPAPTSAGGGGATFNIPITINGSVLSDKNELALAVRGAFDTVIKGNGMALPTGA